MSTTDSLAQFSSMKASEHSLIDSIHVLVVSNHENAKKVYPNAGVFADRQVMSLKSSGVHITTFDIGTNHSPLHIFRKWLELRRTVRRLNPDLVHGRYGTIVGFVAAFASPRALITFCGSDLIPGPSVSLMRRHLGFLLSNLAVLRASCSICVSEELRQALWWRKHLAVVIPDGVDLDLFTPGPQAEARKELGWDMKPPIAVFCGVDLELKGFDVIEAAMEFVRLRIPDVELRILSNVQPAQMPLYFRAADVLLCASKAEGSPNVVKEALACNLPVVSTPVGDVRERLSGVYPSEIVPREPKAFGEAVAKILLTRQRSNGRDHVQELSLDRVAMKVKHCYDRVMDEHRRAYS